MTELQITGGILYLIGTPIGNLDDISFRAIKTLGSCDSIAAEDTRRTRKLLTHLGISKPLISCHDHNAGRAVPEILSRLERGEAVALVTDGGMPSISDPGYALVSQCHEFKISVRLVPGPSAVTGALALSGLPAERFCFEGFLPRKKNDRKRRWKLIRDESRAIIIFEAPHRFRAFLSEMCEYIPDRQICICREMTKLYEDVIRGRPADIMSLLENDSDGNRKLKGEITIVIGSESPRIRSPDDLQIDQAIRETYTESETNRNIAKIVSDAYDIPFRKVYKRLLELIKMQKL
jgi:16S rRNA (cytidine1402-2'-O)-methyltransferase